MNCAFEEQEGKLIVFLDVNLFFEFHGPESRLKPRLSSQAVIATKSTVLQVIMTHERSEDSLQLKR